MRKPFDYLEEFRGKLFKGNLPTVIELFLISAYRYPDKACFTTFSLEKNSLSYSQVKEKIFILAEDFISKGLKPGDNVILTGKNSPEWAVSYLAALAAGGVIVPLDYQFNESEINTIAEFTESKIIVIDEEKYNNVNISSEFKTVKYSLSPKYENYVFNLPDQGIKEPVKRDIEDIAAILFTSGTTGNPKGVMLSHSNLVNDCLLAQGNMDIYHTDVFYALLPLYHTYTMLAVLIETISIGAELVFAQKLVVKQMLADLKQGKVTMFLGVPMLFNRVLKTILKNIREKGIFIYIAVQFLLFISGSIKKITGKNLGKYIFKNILEKASLSSIRICISGGGPLSSSTFKIYNQLGIDFVQGYGLTEASPIIALNPVERFKVKSVGKIIPQIEAKILDPDSDGRGEIAIRGPIVMKGYYKNPEATAEVITADNFLLTGDIGYLDSENYLYLTGRKKSIIVTEGGKNVYPEEIEDKFQLYDDIEQVFIRGYIKDKKNRSEEIEGLFYPSEELRELADKNAVKEKISKAVADVNRTMPQYMHISKIVMLDNPLEMTSSKKIKRHKVEG